MCVPDIIRAHDLDTQFDVEDPLHARRKLTGVFVDAGHCPGSAILVLEGLPGGPVILTNDFRFNKKITSTILRWLAFGVAIRRCIWT